MRISFPFFERYSVFFSSRLRCFFIAGNLHSFFLSVTLSVCLGHTSLVCSSEGCDTFPSPSQAFAPLFPLSTFSVWCLTTFVLLFQLCIGLLPGVSQFFFHFHHETTDTFFLICFCLEPFISFKVAVMHFILFVHKTLQNLLFKNQINQCLKISC